MPPPAAAISRYVAPLARSAYSSSREPAKIRWLWESTKPGASPPPSRRDPGQVEAVAPGPGDRLRVASVGVAHDAGARVGRQHALEPPRRVGAAVGDDDHAGVDRITDADAAAVVDGDPRRAGRRVHEGVEDRPVGDRVR